MNVTPAPHRGVSSRVTGSRGALRCFIAAPAHADVEPVRRILEERNVESVVPYEAPSFGTSIVKKVTSLIDECDIFIAILEDPRHGSNVVFELGYAFARGKKILTLLSPRYDSLPSDLSSTYYIRAEPGDLEAVSFAVDQLLASPGQQHRIYAPPPVRSRPIGDLADRLLARLETASARGAELELGQIVADAVRASGVSVVVETGQPDIGADLAVWSDELETWVGNPLLIELKYKIPTVSAARLVYDQVRSYMRATHAGWTLVLYMEGPPLEDDAVLSLPRVLFMSARDFIESLRTQSFAEIVLSLRNRVAHVR